jgi:DNA-binding CsgD family transcriptional regulator
MDPSILIDELDFGVIACADDVQTVLFANQWARQILSALGGSGEEMAEKLKSVITDHLETHGQANEFSRPARVQLGDGRRISVRFKQLRGENDVPSGFMLILTRVKMRHYDLFDVLNKNFGLSKRECEITMMVRDGYRNEEIARQTQLAVGTVKHYIHRIFTALEVKSRAELVRFIDRRAHDTTHGA